MVALLQMQCTHSGLNGMSDMICMLLYGCNGTWTSSLVKAIELYSYICSHIMLHSTHVLPVELLCKLQGQYEWKVDQLQQHIAEQQHTCAQLKAQLQIAHKVIIHDPPCLHAPAVTRELHELMVSSRCSLVVNCAELQFSRSLVRCPLN